MRQRARREQDKEGKRQMSSPAWEVQVLFEDGRNRDFSESFDA
jgi:hypothetical protein